MSGLPDFCPECGSHDLARHASGCRWRATKAMLDHDLKVLLDEGLIRRVTRQGKERFEPTDQGLAYDLEDGR